MALSIDWLNKIIFVPKSDLTFIGGTLYQIDTNDFRLELKAIEASEDGMPHLDTHRHNTEITIAGDIYARAIEIINGYTVTFEDGQYAVKLVGSNNNIHDEGIINRNQVSLVPTNSAGLIRADITALATDIQELLGLSFKNSFRHTRIYDSNNRLTNEKFDTYDSAVNAGIHDGVTGLIASYDVTYVYAGDDDKVDTMLFTRTA